MPSPNRIRTAGQAIPVVNTVFDVANVGYEMVNPNEPSRAQRLLNALIVGGGNVATGALTGGADVIPQLLGAFGVKSAVQNVNPDAQLRRLAYRLGQGKEIGIHASEQDEAIQRLAAQKKREATYTPEQIKQIYSRGLGGMF
jgi:chemotaxis response regulator CheB